MFLNFLEKEHSRMLSTFVKLADVVLYLFCSLLAYYIHFGSFTLNSLYQLALLFAVILIVPVFSLCGVYQPIRGTSFTKYFHFLCLALIVLMMLMASTAFILKVGDYYSRAWFLTWNFLAFIVFIVFRMILLRILHVMRKRGLNQKRIIIIGNGVTIGKIIKRLNNAVWTGFKVVSLFNDGSTSADSEGEKVIMQPLPPNLAEYIAQNDVAEVWLALSLWDSPFMEKLHKELSNCVANVRYFPDIPGVKLLNYSVTEVLGLPVINVIASPMVGINQLIKAIEDRVLAFLILLLISPVFLVIAILVKLSSPGPVFYRQKRVGWNGGEFSMLKFRSMPVDAEVKTGAVWAKAEDKRATKIGALLRKTSLDELPQFINVLKGDMSIVGPRPERLVFVEKFKHEIPMYMQKHLVKAGITGWAQVNGWRGDTSLEKRIEYDLYYINHWSLGFDLQIIFLTVFKGFVNKNAY